MNTSIQLFARASLIAVLSVGISLPASAVTLDFEDPALIGTDFMTNLQYGGLRLSPRWYMNFSVGMGAETRGLGGAPGVAFPENPGYLGNAIGDLADVVIDANGSTFSVLSFDGSFGSGWLRSSKGGSSCWGFLCNGVSVPPTTTFSLQSPLWTDVQWIAIDFEHTSFPIGRLDNLVVQVPEPSTVWLALLGLPAVLAARRRVTGAQSAA